MNKNLTLFAPGPTNILPEVSQILSGNLIHHRTSDFSELYGSLCHKLETIYDTKLGDTLVITSGGSGGLEAGIASLFRPHDEVIVIVNGHFSENMLHTAEALHLTAHVLHYPWGSVYNILDVEAMLQQHPSVKGILVVHSETSTGALSNIQALGALTKGTDRLLIVDAVSSLLFNEFHFDEWGVDYAVSASQKGFGLPPGICFVCVSEKGKSRFNQESSKFYLDLARYVDYKHRLSQTPSTPNILTMMAADVSFDIILKNGVSSYQKKGMELIRQYKKRLEPLGFIPLIRQEANQVGGVVAFFCPEGIHSPSLQAYLGEHYGLWIECGVGAIRDKVIRIATMYPFTLEQVTTLLNGIETYVKANQ